MLGALITRLDRPELTTKVLETLDPELAAAVEMRAAAASMATSDFVAGAVKAFVDSAETIYGSSCSQSSARQTILV